MTFWNCVYNFLLMPLQLVFEVIYSYAYQLIGNPGLAIIALSLAMNILVLPLYRRADAMQEAQRDTEAKLSKGVAHIRKTFRGDERTMMLQTYYRQNHYSPVSALRGATSLLLEIPFFIAAYRFLSGLDLLSGVPFGPIADLSKPDALIVIGGLSVNILPILMTVINCVSSAIFSKDYPLKTKIQLYAMAAFFLVFLYTSPSGLVFYWTLNNLFSLVKTIFYKLKNPRKVLSVLLCVIGVGVIGFTAANTARFTVEWDIMFIAVGVLLCLPLVISVLKKKGKTVFPAISRTADNRLFIFGAVFLAILTGALIPSAVINASPQEFADVYNFVHPIWYVVSSLLIAFGTFVLWVGVFYWLASPKAKLFFGWGVWIADGIAIADYLFFGKHLGTLSSILQYDESVNFTLAQKGINLLVILLLAAAMLILVLKKEKWVRNIILVAGLTICCMSIINVVGINRSIASIDSTSAEEDISVSLSKNEKNVVVFMLDRAMGAYIPYLFNENPELEEQFDGFTYYFNVISFGGHTNFTTPSLFGGYEYTPAELNLRSSETLAEKHNEALKVLPVLFDNSGFNVTVCDLPYAGYQEIPDMSIFDDYPDIQTYITTGAFTEASQKTELVADRNRNFFCYSITKISPLLIQSALYNEGQYHQLGNNGQVVISSSVANSTDPTFEDSYSVLENLSAMTTASDSSEGTFLMMQNDTTHNTILFQEPEYELSSTVDNTEYDQDNTDRFTVNGVTLRVESADEYGAYETNMAALKKIGEWLDYLREIGVYDNTKIILVSDHGEGFNNLEELLLDDTAYASAVADRQGDAEYYFPLLLVKDFNSTGFTVSNEFMTNADVATIATDGVISDPVNPFTGNAINSDEKTAHDQLIIASSDWVISSNNGNQFLPARWYSVHDSIWDKSNWTLAAEDAILTGTTN